MALACPTPCRAAHSIGRGWAGPQALPHQFLVRSLVPMAQCRWHHHAAGRGYRAERGLPERPLQAAVFTTAAVQRDKDSVWALLDQLFSQIGTEASMP